MAQRSQLGAVPRSVGMSLGEQGVASHSLGQLGAVPRVWCLCLALLVLLTTVCEAYEGCAIRYGRRGCNHKVLEGVLVQCDGMGQERYVPQNLPKDAVYMSLVNFDLDHLMRVNFSQFRTVECLTIVDSGVLAVDEDAFQDMEALTELVLENTRVNNTQLAFVNHPQFKAHLLSVAGSRHLHKLAFDATKTLHHLKTLDLHGNALDTIPAKLFPELRKLEVLDLSRNRLKELDWLMLRELAKLNQLHLDGNHFQTIPDSMFAVFYAVKELSLSRNPFHCNCKLRWLKEFFEEVLDKNLDYDRVVCASPVSKSMQAMRTRDFRCSEPNYPVISYYNMEEFKYVLNCSSQGDPGPTLTLTLPDGRKVISPPSEDLSIMETVTPEILSAGGKVTCMASNTEGDAVSTLELPLPESNKAMRLHSRLEPLYLVVLLLILALYS